MDRAQAVFAILFLALPLIGLLAVPFVPGAAFGLAFASIALLAAGFLVALGFIDV